MQRATSTFSFDATTVKLGSKSRSFNNSVGNNNTFDFYQVKVSKSSLLNVQLNKLFNNADLFLFNESGKLLKKSVQSGTKYEKISIKAVPGTYFIAVSNLSTTTSYQLKLLPTPQKKGGSKPTPLPSGKITFNIPGLNSFSINSTEYNINWNGTFNFDDFDSDFENDPFFNNNGSGFNNNGTGAGGIKTIDLSGSDFTVFPSIFTRSDDRAFDVDFKVKNTGNTNSGGFQINFYLSLDNQFGGNDYLLGSYPISDIGPGSAPTLNKALTLPAANDLWWTANSSSSSTFSTYYVGMVVDATNVVAEINETNNSSTSSLFGDYDDIDILW